MKYKKFKKLMERFDSEREQEIAIREYEQSGSVGGVPTIAGFPYFNFQTNTAQPNVPLDNLEQTDIELTSNFAIGRWLVENFPETYDEFVEQQEDQFELFCKKHRDYGPANLDHGSIPESVEGILIRMKDKLNRVHKLNNENAKPENESLIDSLNDISNYANIAIIFLKGKWGL